MVSVKGSIRGDRRPRRFFLRGNIMSAGANVLHSHMQTGATGSAIKLALGRMRHKLQAPCDCVTLRQPAFPTSRTGNFARWGVHAGV